MLRRSCGTFHAPRRPMSRPATRTRPVGGDLVAQEELEQRRLPGARGPTRKTNSPLRISSESSCRATTSPLYVLVTFSKRIMRAQHRKRYEVGLRPAGVGRDSYRSGRPCAASAPLQVRLDERVEVAVEHRLHVAGLVRGCARPSPVGTAPACRCGSGCRTRRPACRPRGARAPCGAPRGARSASRAARICIALARFWSCERSFWHDTTTPVGMCVMRTAESVTFTC